MNALGQIPEQPVLTPAERFETLIDAITTYQTLLMAANQFGDLLGSSDAPPNQGDIDALDAMYDRSDDAAMVVCHVARTLMADGLLERCAALLRLHPVGQH